MPSCDSVASACSSAFSDPPTAQPMTEDYPYGYSGYEQEKLSKGFTGKGAADLKESFALGEPPYARAHARACAYAHTLAIFTTPTSLGPHRTSLLLSFAWPAFSCNLCLKCDALGLQGRRTQRRGCLLGAFRSLAQSGSSKLGRSTDRSRGRRALAVLSASSAVRAEGGGLQLLQCDGDALLAAAATLRAGPGPRASVRATHCRWQ